MQRRAFRYPIYPNAEQQQALAVQFGHARFVYNWGLAIRKAHYHKHGQDIGFYELKRQLTQLKHTPGFDWLREADSQVLQAKIEDLDRAYQNFFEKRAGYPRFKSRKGEQKIRYPQRFKFDGNHIYLPKVGWVKAVFHRPLAGTPKNVTVTKTKSGNYFVSVQCEMKNDSRPHGRGEIGIDLGLKHFAVLSSGEKIEHPQVLRKAEQKLKRLQRQLSRKQKGSANREKARLRLARTAEQVANQRRDFLDKLSHNLAKQYHTVKIENLNVSGMLKNHKLAKSISDSGWGMFGRMLEYKAADCQRIDRFYPSSKTCSVCGFHNQKLQLQHRFWTCPTCKTEHDRDHNAAINILKQPTAGAAGRHTPVESVSDGDGFRATRNAR
ncbi:MAG: transposase [Chloroflexi bacterium]|nr:transposase [Chloroflexota bacterium]